MEWSAVVGVFGFIAGAGATVFTVGKFQGGFIARVESIEKFVDEHDGEDTTFRTRCHSELLEEIRETRRTQIDQFDKLNARLDKVISFRSRKREGENGE